MAKTIQFSSTLGVGTGVRIVIDGFSDGDTSTKNGDYISSVHSFSAIADDTHCTLRFNDHGVIINITDITGITINGTPMTSYNTLIDIINLIV